MKRPVIRCFVLFLALMAISLPLIGEDDTSDAVPTYRITEVKRTLLREEPRPEERLQVGEHAPPGAILRTGWWSSATIESPESGAVFVLDARTRARLTENRPGILINLRKGRLRAIFDTLSEGQESDRIVTTPSAVLAVRGTEYGVAVSRSGETRVVVFSGVVDVTDLAGRRPPVAVSAGQFCTIQPGRPPGQPMPHMMSPGDWDHGRMPSAMPGGDRGPLMGGSRSGHMGGGSMGHGG